MKPGRHAVADGSFGRSAGAALGRGILLLAVAVVIGVVLLNATDSDPPGTRVSAAGATVESTVLVDPSAGTTTTPSTSAAVTPPPPSARAPKDVKVVVANGSNVDGAAAAASDLLRPKDYNVLSPANAVAKTGESSVLYTAGFENEAAAVAVVLSFPATTVKAEPTPLPVTNTRGADVIVIVGSDQGARFQVATTTTTTKKA